MTDLKSNNEFDSLESFFHEKLKDGAFAKAEGPWKQVEAELEKMEKEKRRRRFFWFFSSGIVLLGGLAALWFFVLDEKFTSRGAHKAAVSELKNEKASSKNNSENQSQPSAHENSNQQTLAKKNTTDIPTSVRTEPVNYPSGSTKIQLAACSKKANPALFNKLPFAVIEVEGKDGIIRYFAQTEVTDENLQTIRNSGFATAFVKKNFVEENNVLVKEAGSREAYSAAYVPPSSHSENSPKQTGRNKISSALAAKSNSQEEKQPAITYGNKTETNSNSIASNNDKQNISTATVTNNSPNNTLTPGNTNNSVTINTNSSPTNQDQNSATANNETKKENPPAETKSDSLGVAKNETKKDSVPPVATSETKKDSVPPKTEPKDSSHTAAAYVAPTPFTPEWAILLLAGPNIFTSQAQSNLYTTSNESQPVSLNTELKIQYRPIKLLSFSGGLNYTSFSIKQDITTFLFDKNRTEDFILYSAYGSMAVPMSTLLQGYSMQAPFDTFGCKYSQTSKLNMINIPLEANLHLLNKSRVNIFMGLGANSSFVLSQHTTVTLHKENLDNTLTYNKVTVTPFSLSLMLSLGCDVRIGKKLYLSFVPSYRYGLTNMSTTNSTTFNPAYFSGNAGLKFKF